MSAEVVNISRFSYRRSSHPNPKNIHTVTDMAEWLHEHPTHAAVSYYNDIIEQIFVIPKMNLELSDEIGKATLATLDLWATIMFGPLGEKKEEEERKIS